MRPLLWTSKSLRKLSGELTGQGFKVGHVTVGTLLKKLGYSLQANKKTHEGGNVTDRDEQFEYINEMATSFMSANCPVISVDCKKKELIGNYKNSGQEWHLKGTAPEVKVYDLAHNEGWVSVGISKDTAQFAVNTIKSWWDQMGKSRYGKADKLLITADCGGSNGVRNKLWKKELQDFATQSGLTLYICHYPPGTSKWNKIEHRLFAQITKNRRGKPLESLETIVKLIENTTTTTGLKVQDIADKKQYEKGIKVSDQELKKINLTRHEFHGQWNYIINPELYHLFMNKS